MELATHTNRLALETSALGVGGEVLAMAPGRAWSSAPHTTSSDMVVFRNQNLTTADAWELSRSNAFARSALRSHQDSVLGANLKLQLSPDARLLGVTDQQAADWTDMAESEWAASAESDKFVFDAQRSQTFSGLMRTAYASYYVAAEALGAIEWKKCVGAEDRTCLYLITPERLSDPHMRVDHTGKRRMGVERDKHGAPTAYHIREQLASDGMWKARDTWKWNRVERHTWWGRPKILHHFKHDRPDMTRGMTGFASIALALRMFQDYARTELESAAVRATYAAVIESELDYEDAMRVIGPEHASAVQRDGLLDLSIRAMAESAKYYRGQDVRFGKAKVAHLLPNEKLKMVQGTAHMSALKEFASASMYEVAAGAGVDYASLTKDYSHTNYSGARAALFDVWRGYEAERAEFFANFAMPFVGAWLEERIAIRKTMPMLGGGDFYDMRSALVKGTFETWGRPRLDPLKEAQADKIIFDMGAKSLKDVCAQEGKDYREVLAQRGREKALMKKLGLKPEDIDWTLIMNQGAQKPKGGDGVGDSGGGGGGT